MTQNNILFNVELIKWLETEFEEHETQVEVLKVSADLTSALTKSATANTMLAVSTVKPSRTNTLTYTKDLHESRRDELQCEHYAYDWDAR